MVTPDDVNRDFRYDPETGLFTRIRSVTSAKAGDVSVSTNGDGYTNIKVKGKTYKAHRLAWLVTYGCWPNGPIDHINGNRADNRIANLRECSTRENGQNRSEHRNGALVGASYVKRYGTWSARIKIGGRRFHIGNFKTQQAAHEAYMAAAAKAEDAILYWQSPSETNSER